MGLEIRVIAIDGIPEVAEGDDLAGLITDAVHHQEIPISDGDIMVVTQKVVSKAEGKVVQLGDVQPSEIAVQLSRGYTRDPRHTEMILRESVRIVRMDRGNIISETRHGFICANAGIDASNVPGEDTVALLPDDPDASAQRIRAGIKDRSGKDLAVIISDTFGRPWREGAVNVAIGVAGIAPLQDYRGQDDLYGNTMRTTVIALADELASAAELATGKLKNVPVALIKGLDYNPAGSQAPEGAGVLIRPADRDMFR